MSTIFNKEIKEVMIKRHSVRNYENRLLSKEIIGKIEKYINEVKNPFNGKIRIKLIKKDDSNKDVKLGTYGVIKGVNYFLAVASEKGELDLESLGYVFEKVVLYCTFLGLGTVWMGGTFSKSTFAKAMNIKENEAISIVSPLGYEGGKKSLLASMMGSKNKKRKSYEEVFFNNNFNNPLSKKDAESYSEVLEMVRIAPSSMNKQPWRILKVGNKFHFYTAGKIEMNRIDIGIALCHFHLMAEEQNLNGEFKIIEPKIESEYKYVMSWIG
ncbi:nitroreductase family protein [Clostridium gasigenes]|uniref:nitroreductase family protein n=1 Tax=Clostridium gasigenes TaxID=94869 RepID=UPI001C0DF316|nr:nitroreductase family protein [Clostridium gasigenes]MBU3108947.1 nitroreductase family protein [Clostridium gasigenes]